MPIPLPVIPFTMRVALNWQDSVTAQTAVNVIHIKTGAADVPASDVFELLQDTVTQAMWDAVTGTAAITRVDITDLDGVSGTVSFPTGATAQWSGTNGTDLVPAVAELIKLGTGVRGRANRGRIFLPMIAEGSITKGSIIGGSIATSQPAWTAFLAALASDATTPSTLVVAAYDRRHAGAGAHATDVTTATVETLCGTQRRRQGRLR